MDTALDYLAHIRADIASVTELAGADAEALQRPVPACPGWSVRDVMVHLGGVHRMVTAAITQGAPSRSADHEPPPGADLQAWLRTGAEDMLSVLGRDPDQPAWSFDPQGRTVGFWRRRQAMENVIHRVDVQQALGVRPQVDGDLAADGVAEVLDTMIRLRGTASQLPPGSLVLRATDRPGVWTLGEGAPERSVEGDVAALFLTLWKRLPPDALTADPDVLALLRLPLTP